MVQCVFEGDCAIPRFLIFEGEKFGEEFAYNGISPSSVSFILVRLCLGKISRNHMGIILRFEIVV